MFKFYVFINRSPELTYWKEEVQGFEVKNFQSVDVTSSHHGKLFEFVQFGVSSLKEIGIQVK